MKQRPPSGGGEEEPGCGRSWVGNPYRGSRTGGQGCVDDLEPGTDEGDGGIGGDVDDWDDETDVELPVN